MHAHAAYPLPIPPGRSTPNVRRTIDYIDYSTLSNYVYVGMCQAWQACGTLAPSTRRPIKLTFSVDGRHAVCYRCHATSFASTPSRLLSADARHQTPVGLGRGRTAHAYRGGIQYMATARGHRPAADCHALSAAVPITHGAWGSRVAPEQRPATPALHHHLIDVERNAICHRPARNTRPAATHSTMYYSQ